MGLKRKAVVLLVEDNPAHAELVKRALVRLPTENIYYHVRDGEEALDYLYHRGHYQDVTLSPRPTVILLDWRLPKLSGLEVLQRIKQDATLRLIPTIVLTSSDAPIDIQNAYQSHANSYLVKPPDYSELFNMMRDLGAFWFENNRQTEEGSPLS